MSSAITSISPGTPGIAKFTVLGSRETHPDREIERPGTTRATAIRSAQRWRSRRWDSSRISATAALSRGTEPRHTGDVLRPAPATFLLRPAGDQWGQHEPERTISAPVPCGPPIL